MVAIAACCSGTSTNAAALPEPSTLKPNGESPAGEHRQAGQADAKWAWVELNYRPHAYQTAVERWPVLTSVDFTGFRSISC
jgi:hypothetical protein